MNKNEENKVQKVERIEEIELDVNDTTEKVIDEINKLLYNDMRYIHEEYSSDDNVKKYSLSYLDCGEA